MRRVLPRRERDESELDQRLARPSVLPHDAAALGVPERLVLG